MQHIALVTLLNVLVIFIAMFLVGRARTKYGIKAPAIIGNVDFERVFRAHQNTLEQTIMFLPVLWLAGTYSDPKIAGYLGYAWIVGRLWFIFAYRAAAQKRGAAFGIGMLAWALLFVMAAKGIAQSMFTA
jgi:glutathione S-transferase